MQTLSTLFSDKNKTTFLSLLGAVSTVSAAYAIYKSFRQDKEKLEIPTPKSCYPYVGHLFSMGDPPGKKVAEWHAEYGPIIRIRMGVQTWIMIGDPELAHQLFVSDYGVESSGRCYATYTSKYYSMGGRGIVFPDADSSWKKARSVVLKVLAPKAVENYTNLIEQGAIDLAERLLQTTKTDGKVNVVKHFEYYSLSIISKVTLGKQFHSIDDPDFKRTSGFIEKSVKLAGIEFDLPSFLPVLNPIFHLMGIEKKMETFVYNERNVEFRKYIVESRKKKLQNIITALIDDSEYFDEDDILIIISDMLAAGSETVATSLLWAICILCNYPKVQKIMQEEIDSLTKSNDGHLPTFADRLMLPYCVSVMKECMRFRSTLSFGIPHRATEEIVLKGYTIPKDSILIASMDYMHSGSGYYANEKEFNPERFINDTKTMTAASNGRISERDHFNFGWGRRICPGIYLAEVEIFNAFVHIFSRSTIEPIYENGVPLYPNMNDARSGGVTTLPLPFNVRVVERECKSH
ncbi:cytochrome P450 [Backusella circina FSU 941]|nr:cytochrome P450 [Backusella circina FSU 941]